MNDKTKIWIVETDSYLFGHIDKGFFVSKEDAEYYVWKKLKEQEKMNSFMRDYAGTMSFACKVREVSPQTVVQEKDYKDFIKEKKANLNAELERKQKCSVNDSRDAERLIEEIKSLEEKK